MTAHGYDPVADTVQLILAVFLANQAWLRTAFGVSSYLRRI